MSKQNLQIHSENILPIIKKWLYSDRDIFVRELVSNACDAIHKVKILRDQGETQANDEEFKVEIKIDKEAKTLTFTDTGIGMDADEVQKYIAQIAFSGAEEFMDKYKSNKESDQFIGHFGLGFYSSYMVAQKVEINTLSYKENAEPVFWSCDGSAEYIIEKGTRSARGTEITLYIDKDNEDYLEEAKLKQILSHYCSFLPYPVYLGEEKINTQQPLWIKAPSDCTPEEYKEFYRYLYPMEEEPLFWVHLNVDYPFHLKGILFFPKIRRDFDVNKNTVKLYCNRVFVADNCKDIIPNYLMALRGVIDSPDIPLNVSRSYLQMDRTVRQLSNHITKKVADSLNTLYRNDKDRFIECWEDVSMVVKMGVLEDEKFYDKVKDIIIWKDTQGNWITVDEYLNLNKDKTNNKIIYTKDPTHLSHFQELYKQKGIDVLCATSPIDPYLMQFIERKLTPATFQRIDASIDDNLLDKDREKNILDAEGKSEASHIASFIKSLLDEAEVEVEAKSLASDSLPGFVMLDEQQRRMRDYMLSMGPKDGFSGMNLFGKKTFVVNTNNPLVSMARKLHDSHPDLSKEVVKELYQLALLSQREMDPNALNDFINRTNHILEKLTEQIVHQKTTV
ncbi:High temperature protein G [Candidatus Rubidus massiliensis]|nr:MAG: molecular chaperone HtpG [Chlamydia sp. 32-24]CDZ79698.1 High temperature protein G [Candidatus Rubidus massiliensis]